MRRWAQGLRDAHRRATPLLAAWLVLLGLAAPAQAQVKIEYYHLDPIGSVRLVTDSAGAEVARYDYHPFGEEVPPVTTGQPRRYAGKERDAETSYDYFGGRYYAGRVGRFTTVDPAYELEDNLLDPQRWNRYAYVRNNPLRYSDPDGRIIETLWDAANVIMGARSLVANVAVGNWAGAAIDVVGIVADAAATVAPGVPGGAGTLTRSLRAADRITDASRSAYSGAVSGATEVVQRWMSKAELKAVSETGLVRGGRSGVHHATDAANASAQRARQRLALEHTPEIRVTMEVLAGTFSRPSRVQPKYNMPGGGTERTATGPVPAKVLKVDGKP